MEKTRLEEVLNNILGWAAEHNDEFMNCIVKASEMTLEEAKEFDVEKYHEDFDENGTLFDYKIVTEDDDEFFFPDYPTAQEINAFIAMGKDITIYHYDSSNKDDWEEVESYHA